MCLVLPGGGARVGTIKRAGGRSKVSGRAACAYTRALAVKASWGRHSAKKKSHAKRSSNRIVSSRLDSEAVIEKQGNSHWIRFLLVGSVHLALLRHV